MDKTRKGGKWAKTRMRDIERGSHMRHSRDSASPSLRRCTGNLVWEGKVATVTWEHRPDALRCIYQLGEVLAMDGRPGRRR